MRTPILCLAVAAVAATLTLRARQARADSTECREGVLVETGYGMRHVWELCGDPSRRAVAVGGNPRSEHWVYLLGSGTFPRILQFYDGVLVRIRIGHRG